MTIRHDWQPQDKILYTKFTPILSIQRCGRQDADTIYGQLPVRYHPALPPGDRQKSAENSNQHLHLHGDSVQSYYDTIARNRGDRT